MKNRDRIRRAQSMLCRAAMAHDMERLRELRRAAEMIVAVPGPCATLYVTVPRPKER